MRRRAIHFLSAAAMVCILVFGTAVGGDQVLAGEANRYEVGFITGAGTGPAAEGRYVPILLIAHLAYNINTVPRKDDRSGIFSVFIEPQVNPVINPGTEYEAGLAFGVKYLYPLTEKLYPYLLAEAGPHYISLNSVDQAPGFSFLLSGGAGLYYFLSPGVALNAGYRIRHISNAGLRKPNIGINTHMGVAGISFFF